MSSPVKVKPHHVAMFTKDIKETSDWWEKIFGFKKMFQNGFYLPDYGEADMAWIKVADDFYIELYDFPGLEDTQDDHYWKEYGTKHICFYVEDEDFDKMVDHLEANDVPISVKAEHSPERLGKQTTTRVIFFSDPNGNRIELQETFTPGEY